MKMDDSQRVTFLNDQGQGHQGENYDMAVDDSAENDFEVKMLSRY